MDVLFKIESIEIFTQVLEDILNNLYDVNDVSAYKTIDIYSVKTAKEEIKKMILETNLNTKEMNEALVAKHFTNDEKVRIFMSLLDKKKNELLNLTLVHYNSSFGETLNTFDWKLKLVYGSNELKTFSYPLLQMALYTTVNHKPAKRLYELNKDMLSSFIETLEGLVGDHC